MAMIWYWVFPIWSDLPRFGQIWSDLVIRVTEVDEDFLLFFVKISRKLRSYFSVIFRKNMVHNKIKTYAILYVVLLTVC